MKLILTSPVEGKQPGATVDVNEDRAEWLLVNGYAKAEGGNKEDFGRNATNVPDAKNPTLAQNREAPGEDVTKTSEVKAQRRASKPAEEKPKGNAKTD